ncbi:MAG: LapA family protein [Fibrobacter sp.]|nr:LapA family protein [Fibrobacter sp.]
MMRVIKWLAIFGAAFFAAWILIFTFTQPQFKETASARIFTYYTPPIPVYLYVAGAFAMGLLIGLAVALYYYITYQARIHKKNKQIRVLEEEVKKEIPGESFSEEQSSVQNENYNENIAEEQETPPEENL